MFPNVPLYPGPSGPLWAMCTVPKGVASRGKEGERKAAGWQERVHLSGDGATGMHEGTGTERRKHGNRRGR